MFCLGKNNKFGHFRNVKKNKKEEEEKTHLRRKKKQTART